jgi:hypothetical protein
MASPSVADVEEVQEEELKEETGGNEEKERADLAHTGGENQSQDQLQRMVTLLTNPPLLPTDTVPKISALPDLLGLFSAPGERGLLELEKLQVSETLLFINLTVFVDTIAIFLHHPDHHSATP